MRPQGSQQWRPKLKVQCVPDVPSVAEVKSSGVVEDVTAVAEGLESEKRDESRVSSSVEVNQLVIQSMKKNRGKLKRKIEAATNTSLLISKQKTGCFVVVEGISDDAVKQATKRLQDLLEKVDAKADDGAASTPSDSAQLLHWVPKAVRGLHTSAADKLKEAEVAYRNEELDDTGTEKISGSIHVDKKLLRLLKGHKNEVKERIEKSTNTSIRLGSPVVVEGASEECVQKALEEIQRILDEGVADSKFQYSHFISLPLNMHAPLVKQLDEFQESVLVMLGIPLTEEPTAEGANKAEDAAPVRKETEVQTASVSKTASAAASQADDTETEAAAATDLKVVTDQADDENLSEAETNEVNAADKLFEQSVLSSLGIDPKEARQQEIADSVLKDSVLASLGISAEEAQQVAQEKAENKKLESIKELAQTGPVDVSLEDVPVNGAVSKTGQEATTMDYTEGNVETGGKVAEDVADDRAHTTADLEDGEEGSGETEEYEPLKEVAFVKKKISASDVEPSIFIKSSRFHLTVLMLKLWNEERIDKAREVLKNSLPKVASALDGKPVSIALTGLEIMKGSPKNTRVLYAKVTETDGEARLARACQVIIDEFVNSGLVLGKDCEQTLKLHATVMNTSHRRSKSRYKNKGFDATDILAKFGDEVWGEYQILEAHLSERFKYDENGYYHRCGSIAFPGNEIEVDNAE